MKLPRLTVLNELYAVRSVVGKVGPLDVTYLAWDLANEEQVILREYLPIDFITREADGLEVRPTSEKGQAIFAYGMERFRKESEVLARIEHPNVIRQRDQFVQHGTAYRVSDYHAGATLDSILSQQGGRIPEKSAVTIMMPLLDGLRMGHKNGLIHGRIAPETIFLSKSGRPVLLSFFTTQILLAQRVRLLEQYVNADFSPLEQAEAKGKQGPWTDVYGCAATLYYMLAGECVPRLRTEDEYSAFRSQLQQDDALSASLQRTLIDALHPSHEQRIGTIDEFRERLVESITTVERNEHQALEAVRREVMETSATSTYVPAAEFDAQPEELEEVSAGIEFPPLPEPPDEVHHEEMEKIEAPATNQLDPFDPADFLGSPITTPAQEFGGSFDEPVPVEEDLVEESVPDISQDLVPLEMGGDGDAMDLDDPSFMDEEERDELPPMFVEADAPTTSWDVGGEQVAEDEEGPVYPTKRRRSPVTFYLWAALTVVVMLGAWAAYNRIFINDGDVNTVDPEMYAAVLAKGDSLLGLAVDVADVGNIDQARPFFSRAREHFLIALAVNPGDAMLESRIDSIDRYMTQVASFTLDDQSYLQYMERGDSLKSYADALMLSGDSVRARTVYSQAKDQFMSGLTARPGDSLALARLSIVNQSMLMPPVRQSSALSSSAPTPRLPASNTAASEEAQNEAQYELYRSQGDSAIQVGNYAEAQRKFIEALEYKPNDNYASSRLGQIEDLLQRNVQLSRYRELINNGAALQGEGRYAEARLAYEQALEILPEDNIAKAAIFELDAIIREEDRLEQVYLSNRTRGDVLNEQGDYTRALESYSNALAAKPEDSYVMGKIEEVQDNIDALEQLQQELPDGMMDTNGVYNFTEEPPEVIGGLEVLQARIRYPALAREAGIEGRVTVRMVVDEEGRMSNPILVDKLGYGIDEEVLRVVQGARFSPGRVGGLPVKSWHTLFFDFKL